MSELSHTKDTHPRHTTQTRSYHRVVDYTKLPVVYRLPGMDTVRVRTNITYKNVDETELQLDLYTPADEQETHPAVILIHGDGRGPVFANLKDHGQYTSWGRLIAACGLSAITANHRRTNQLHDVVGSANDIDDLITYVLDHSNELGIDADRLCIWMCSMGTPFAMRAALNEAPPYIKAIVCYYGMTELQAYYDALYNDPDNETGIPPEFTIADFDEFSASDLLIRRPDNIAPIFIARAGLDRPELNDALDAFIALALDQNVNLTVINHPTGQHAFDILNDNMRSREIIQATLTFMQEHLLN